MQGLKATFRESDQIIHSGTVSLENASSAQIFRAHADQDRARQRAEVLLEQVWRERWATWSGTARHSQPDPAESDTTLRARIDELRHRCDVLQARALDAEQRVNAMLKSTSWRATVGLRVGKNLIIALASAGRRRRPQARRGAGSGVSSLPESQNGGNDDLSTAREPADSRVCSQRTEAVLMQLEEAWSNLSGGRTP